MSTVILYTPLTLMVLNLIFGSFTTATAYCYTARTALRILSLNIAFEGGIHYGIGGALYEISTLPEPKISSRNQVLYSIIPGVSSFMIINWLLN